MTKPFTILSQKWDLSLIEFKLGIVDILLLKAAAIKNQTGMIKGLQAIWTKKPQNKLHENVVFTQFSDCISSVN